MEVDRMSLLAFGLSTALAGTAGLMITLQLSVSPFIGLLYTLKAFAIIVIVGLGNINGVIYASLVLGLSEVMVEFYVPQGGGWSKGVFFVLILGVLLTLLLHQLHKKTRERPCSLSPETVVLA